MVLIILDGWGYRESSKYNAINAAQKPNWDKIWQTYPHTLIECSGAAVGLPDGQMGNSEVGHLNMGAGRLVRQDYTRIEKAINEGEFFSNPVMVTALQKAINTNKAVHIMGLLSPGGVHSHEQHIFTMLKLAVEQGAQNIYLHAFLDGRDTPPQSALPSLNKLNALCASYGTAKIASIIGRYYAMDRDKRWDRTQLAYDLLTSGKTNYHAQNAEEALSQAYDRGETDEFVKPTAIHAANQVPISIEDGDVIIFMNYRADRARQLTRAFTEENFQGFTRHAQPRFAEFVSLTQYAIDINTQIAYPPEQLTHVLGAYIAECGLKQLRIAETEKYAHVTFFFNGGVEKAYTGEERVLIPSSKVATYDLHPEMSAPELTDKLVEAIRSQQYELIVCNYANPDMVGHTGNFEATVHAIEAIDHALGRILQAISDAGSEALITADHGNAECMFDERTNQPHTAHTTEMVPCIYIGRPAKVTGLTGTLSDIAPTLLYCMGLAQPKEMTGRSLFKLQT
jgi:2,3-bisphosphoglycerate-independent phosphoglycerate mutase